VGYSGILGAVERIGFDSLTRRARLGTSERVGVLVKVWQTRPVASRLRTPPAVAGPHLGWEQGDTAASDELIRLA
jgi:hypothetical protein